MRPAMPPDRLHETAVCGARVGPRLHLHPPGGPLSCSVEACVCLPAHRIAAPSCTACHCCCSSTPHLCSCPAVCPCGPCARAPWGLCVRMWKPPPPPRSTPSWPGSLRSSTSRHSSKSTWASPRPSSCPLQVVGLCACARSSHPRLCARPPRAGAPRGVGAASGVGRQQLRCPENPRAAALKKVRPRAHRLPAS